MYEAVREAYCFIARNYYDNRDEICLIGFSRGAFTVRATAQFIHEAGLLTKDGLVHVLELFELWKDQCKQPTKLASFKTKLEAKGLLRSGVQIRACAVWDTVSSLGFPFPGFLPQPAPQKLKFVNSNPSPNVFLNIQALSLQERRRHFHPIVMRAAPSGGVSVQQCWFLGYHSDIGGGRLDNALSVFPLIWIMSKLNMFLDIDVTTIWPINPQHVWGIIRDIRLPDAAVDAVAESLASATSNNTVANRLNGFIEFHKLNQLLEVSFNQERSARGFKRKWHAFTIEDPSNRSPVEKIKDSMTFAFKAGGSWPRMPCRDLYNDEGPYQQEQQIAGAPKHETIHWSVRSLKQCSAIINDEPPLRDATFDYDLDAAKYSDNIKCTWDFKDKEKWWKPWNFEKEIWWKVWAYKKERPSRQVNEANFSALECSLLAHWFCHELTVLKQEVAKDLASELLSSTGLQSFVVAILQKGGHRLDMWGELPTEILP